MLQVGLLKTGDPDTMAASNSAYEQKFQEMQKYIPFLENMIERLKQAQEKPRAAQLDKIQSLYNIVTNTKKKLKYETLIKCEEGLQKLYHKIEKSAPLPTTPRHGCNPENPNVGNSAQKIISNLKLTAARLKVKDIDFASAPASPSPPSTPDPLPTKPILIPTERKHSPPPVKVSDSPNQLRHFTEWRHPPTADISPIAHALNHHNDELYGRSASMSQTEVDLFQRRPHVWKTTTDYGHKRFAHATISHTRAPHDLNEIKNTPYDSIYKNVIINRDDDNIGADRDDRKQSSDRVLLSPLPVEPPLSSADIEDLLSDTNNEEQSKETLDITELESLRAKLVSEIQNLPSTKHSSKKSDKHESSSKSKHKFKDKEKAAKAAIEDSATKSAMTGTELTTKQQQQPVGTKDKEEVSKKSKDTTNRTEDANKSKPKPTPERIIKEADNIFGNLLSSIDEKIFDQKKRDIKKSETCKNKSDLSKKLTESKHTEYTKQRKKSISRDHKVTGNEEATSTVAHATSTDKSERKKQPIMGGSQSKTSDDEPVPPKDENKLPLMDRDYRTEQHQIKLSDETKVSSSASESESKSENSTFIRLADKYQRRPKSETKSSVGESRPLCDIDERIKIPDVSLVNFTGRGLTPKELERFGSIANFPNDNKSTTSSEIKPPVIDPRLTKRPPLLVQPQTNVKPPPQWQQFNQPTGQQGPPQQNFKPQNLSNFYESRSAPAQLMPPLTPQDPFNDFNDPYPSNSFPSGGHTPHDPFSNNMMDTVRVVPNFTSNRPPPLLATPINQFSHNVAAGQYDLAQMGPIDYYDPVNAQFGNRTPHCNAPNIAPPPLISPPLQPRYPNSKPPNLFNKPVPPPKDFHNISSVPKRHFNNKDQPHSHGRESYSRNDYRSSTSGSRDPRRRSYGDSNRNHESDNKYSKINRNNIENKVRGYDPRPQPRKKERELVPSVASNESVTDSTKVPNLQSFKIPKIKRDNPVTTTNTNTSEDKETDVAQNIEPKKEIASEAVKVEVEEKVQHEALNTDTQNPEISSNTTEHCEESLVVVKAEPKEAIINDFVRKLCQSGETDAFFSVLERLGETLNKKKFRRLRRIFESESEGDSDDESKSDEKAQEKLRVKEEEEEDTVIDANKVKDDPNQHVKPSSSLIPPQVVGVRKSLGRQAKLKANLSLIESSKNIKPDDEIETESDKPKRPKRRNALEMLQDDIRDMFICKGVLTATGQRMCRILKEDQDGKANDADEHSPERPIKKSLRNSSEVESSVSPKKSRPNKVIPKIKAVEEPVTLTKRRQPRVVLEKTTMTKVNISVESNSSEASVMTESEGPITNSPNLEKNKFGTSKKTRKAKKQLIESVSCTDADSVISEISSVEGGRAQIFIRRNLRFAKVGNKIRKLRSRITLKSKINDVIEQLCKKHGVDFNKMPEEGKTNNVVANLAGADIPVTESDPPISRKTRGRKKMSKKRKGGRNIAVIKRKPTKKTVQNEETQEVQLMEDNVAKIEIDEEQFEGVCDKEYYYAGLKKYECKLCSFAGKSIVSHYKTSHPGSQVLISRLSQPIAETCIQQSNEKNYENIVQTEEILKCKEYRRKRFSGFCCRFCDVLIKDDFAQSFYDHVAIHTGEDRFGCPKCKFTSNTKASLRCHVQYNHRNVKFSDFSKECGNLYAGYPNVPIVFGYLCELCNFTQLHQHNVEKHLHKYHSDQSSATIHKINMSSIATEVTDKFKYDAPSTGKGDLSNVASTAAAAGATTTSVEGKDGEEMDVDVDVEGLEENTANTSNSEQHEINSETNEKAGAGTQNFRENKEEVAIEVSEIPMQLVAETPIEDPQKELDMNVFVCRDDALDEQKIQSERLRKMQEVVETINQPRRPIFRILETLKSKLESNPPDPSDEIASSKNSNDEQNINVESEEVETLPIETPNSVTPPSTKPSCLVVDSPPTRATNDTNISIDEIVKQLDTPKDTSNTFSQIFDTDELELDAGLIDDVLNLESDWSKWAAGKQNNTIMNTIQRLASVVKQSNETPLPVLIPATPPEQPPVPESSEKSAPVAVTQPGTSKDVIIDVGPISARSLDHNILFYCTDNACSFSTVNQDDFQMHVSFEHSEASWDGDCNECDRIVNMETPKLYTKDALVHLIQTHLSLLKNKTLATAAAADDSPNDTQSKPIIRMRRLSGDKLSEMPTDELEMKIANIRTLSPDSSPMKVNYCNSKESTPPAQTTAKPAMPALLSLSGETPSLHANKMVRQYPFSIEVTKKDPIVHREMLQPYKLCHFFKCMMYACSYSSNESLHYLWHLKGKINKLRLKDWAICPYCDADYILTTQQLIYHIQTEHGECRFQCGYCFYRVASQALIEKHQLTIHRKDFTIYSLPARTGYNAYIKQLPLEVVCQPYECGASVKCQKKFYLKEHFLTHIQKEHPGLRMFTCAKCGEKKDDAKKLAMHYTCHKVGHMQCLYCEYTAEYSKLARAHMAAWHPNQIPKVLIRLFNPALTQKHKDTVDKSSPTILRDLIIRDLDLNMTFNSVPISPMTYSDSESSVNRVNEIKSTGTNSDFSDTPAGVDVVDLSDDGDELNDLIETTLKETQATDKLPAVNIDAMFKKWPDKDDSAPSTPKSKDPEIPLIDIVISDGEDEPIVSSKVDSSADIDPLCFDGDAEFSLTGNESSNVTSSNAANITIKDICAITQLQKSDSDNQDSNSDLVVDDAVVLEQSEGIGAEVASIADIQNTGYSGRELYRCGQEACTFQAENGCGFKEHLSVCEFTKQSGFFKCYHCYRAIRQLQSLIDHIKTHGTDRYGCSLCSYRGPVSNYVSKHMRTKHKIASTRTIPVNPLKMNPETDLFVVCPQGKNSKSLKRKDSNRDLVVSQPTSGDASNGTQECKMVFAPNEVELLPRQPISPFQMRCSTCSYRTKVRTNMVRHLLFHLNSEYVPDTAPVNPVPCLETNEKMFDKMVNLANSSFTETSRMGAKSAAEKIAKKAQQFVLSANEKNNLPAYIPENKRFVCGANDCSYLTVDETMLRCHFRALHMDEVSFKCPHCDELIKDQQGSVSLEKIGHHLKMHDTKLYKCAHCTFHHYQKKIVERHSGDKHPDKVAFVHVVREELEATDAKETIREPEIVPEVTEVTKEFKPWKCGLCKYRTVTRTDIIEHANTNHAVRSQFKCSLCNFKCSYDKNFKSHFDSKHPGQKVEMIHVYFKEECPVPDVTAPSDNSSSEQFDTTPIWLRDMPRVRHIRGILFEETRSTSKKVAKVEAPPIMYESEPEEQDWGEINKCNTKMVGLVSSSTVTTGVGGTCQSTRRSRRSTVTNQSLDQDESSDDESESTASGSPSKDSYEFSCTVCNDYTCKSERQLTEHLCVDMMYEKFGCTCCNKVSHSYDTMKNHVLWLHTKPDPESYIAILTEDKQIEHFILNKVNEQRKQHVPTAKDRKVFNNLLGYTFRTPIVQSSKSNDDIEPTAVSAAAVAPTATPTNMNTILINESEFLDPRQVDKNHCPHCSYFSKYPRDVTKHIVRHWTRQPYQCGICGLKANQSSDVLKHSLVAHKDQPTKLLQLCDPKKIPVKAVQTLRKRKITNAMEFAEPVKKLRLESVRSSSPPLNEKLTSLPVTPPKQSQSQNPAANVSADEDQQMSPLVLELSPDRTEPNQDVMYLCQYCPKRGESVSDIYDHWSLIHKGTKSTTSIFKFRTMARNKVPIRGRILCMYCGFRGSKQNIQRHQKTLHTGKKMYTSIAMTMRPNIRIDCVECQFYAYSINILKWHFKEEHPAAKFETLYSDIKLDEDDSKFVHDERSGCGKLVGSELEASNAAPYQCKWCMQMFRDKELAEKHHNELHSHLEPVLEKIITKTQASIKYSCPECQHCSESYPAMLDHIRSHAKPYICHYCESTFRFPGQVKHHCSKEHVNLEPKYNIVPKSQQILTDLKSNLNIVLEDGTLIKYNEYKKNKRQSTDTSVGGEPPAKVLKVEHNVTAPEVKQEIITPPRPTKVNFARKSTTYVPRRTQTPAACRVQQTARKSTSPFPRSVATEEVYYSYYGSKTKYDNSNITTTMYLGGTQMKVNIQTLFQLTNIFPRVVLNDLKKQKMGL